MKMESGVTIYKPKSAIELRREMAAIPAVIDALQPVERSVFLASTDKPFSEYESRELAGELAKALKFIAKDVGVRELDESERGYLIVRVCEILKRYYAWLTMRDFRMAFEMSITGELDEYLPKGRDGHADRGHYQQFNAEYICKIMTAYKHKRADVIKKANDAMPSPENKLTEQQIKDLRRGTKQNCVNAFEFYKKNGRLPDMSPIAEMLYYEVLSECGLAKEIEVTIEEQRQILERTIHRYASRGMVGDVNRLQQAGTDAKELQFGAYKLARRKALIAVFEKMLADNIVLTDYIKF